MSEQPSGGVRGVCHVFLAMDVAQSIDLNRAAAILRESASRPNLTHRFRAPEFIAYEPPPLRVTQPGDPVGVGSWAAGASTEITLFDFGAASVAYRIPFEGTLASVVALSDALQSHAALRDDARARVGALCRMIEPAAQRPGIKPQIEDYAVFVLEQEAGGAPPGAGVETFLADHAPILAQILRGDAGTLSEQEVREAMTGRLSFTTQDAAIIDWSAAVLLDARPGDVLAVLEFANVELLEMRYLDQRLDEALERSYQTLVRQRWWSRLLGGTSRDLKRLASMQTDNALLFEGVNNAIKLVGDQYLARLYRVAAQRMGVPEWQAGVRRKLGTLESIYSKVSDHAASMRMEFIEWIVVALIALEVVMGLVK